MKIIKYGNIKPLEVNCGGCHAVLEIVPDDLKEISYNGVIRYYVKCPVCGYTFIMYEAEDDIV